ncbi:ATP-dependent Clp protease proteolytic subunit [Lachnospiraceae bacterium ASD5720]|uniref:ATP-dependent Clp protease proteolytic subunit n=2 Tax=Diplocloster agilis TaxID=2850323 RepID=A0A949K0C6_9FIRM|nr:ATP-dependent Clp protease proteolytic subunit [Diplocloster agilis]MBU9737561.1 ATP-dependent Clp protease proteolytic subunit [Diplocloster agilis]
MDAAPENKQGGQDENHDEKKDQELKKEQDQEQLIREAGQMTLDENAKNYKIHLLSIIGEIEGHECLPANTKTTKYEHVLPQLAAIEDSQEIEGLLVLINTVGGDVESGLAIAEMIASLSKPSVSLVLGGSHSIGVPLAVATEYSFIVPTGTMIIHPVRMTGMVIGVPQTYDYFKKIQDRIVGFIASHCNTTEDRLEQLMMETGILTKDVGTILVGSQSVDEGIINEVGGIKEAMAKLYAMIEERRGN